MRANLILNEEGTLTATYMYAIKSTADLYSRGNSDAYDWDEALDEYDSRVQFWGMFFYGNDHDGRFEDAVIDYYHRGELS